MPGDGSEGPATASSRSKAKKQEQSTFAAGEEREGHGGLR